MLVSCGVLDKGIEYEVRVAARNSVGYSEEAHLTIKTPEGSESVVILFSGTIDHKRALLINNLMQTYPYAYFLCLVCLNFIHFFIRCGLF